MKIQPKDTLSFIKAPTKGLRAILIYGPEFGLIAEYGNSICRSVVKDLSDPFQVIELYPKALATETHLLADEMVSYSLMGGRRVIRIREAGDGIMLACKTMLDATEDTEHLCVIEAGDLDKRSKLRTLFETHPKGAALACYAEELATLRQTITQDLKEHGLNLQPEALNYLSHYLLGNRLLMRRELEKLAVYMGTEKNVTLQHVQDIVTDQTDSYLEDPAWFAADGDYAALDQAYTKLMQQGENPVAIIRAAQRHFHRLMLCVSGLQSGQSLDQVVASLAPPIFYKVKARFLKQVQSWPITQLQRVLDILLKAEMDAKSSNLPTEIVISRYFYQIASFSRR